MTTAFEVHRPRIFRRITALCLSLIFVACSGRSVPAEHAADPASATLSAEALRQRLVSAGAKPLVVDVREPHEFNAGHIADARIAPLGNVVNDLASVDKDREIVLVCRSGNRSGKAQRALAERGYSNLRNMEGGMLEWERRGFPVETGKP